MKVMAKDQLAVARVKKGLNGADLARKIGLSRVGYYHIESRDNGASPDTAKKICEALDEEFDDIFKIENA